MTDRKTAELSALYVHRRAETRPIKNPNVTTFSACDCGKISRTGTCGECLSRAIRRLERSL